MTTITTITTGTFAKLDGEWLVKVTSTEAPKPGSTVQITKRDGSTKTVTVGATTSLDNEDGTWLVDFVADERPARRDNRPGYWPSSRRSGRRGHKCITGGNCSSLNGGRNCGGYDCDAN